MDIQTLDEACVAMHEWFASLIRAGFTEDQALKYIAYQTAANKKEEGEDG